MPQDIEMLDIAVSGPFSSPEAAYVYFWGHDNVESVMPMIAHMEDGYYVTIVRMLEREDN